MVWSLLASVAFAEAPQGVEGRYDVVAISENGAEPEEYVDKMRRRALALGQDCFISRRTFDFGTVPAGQKPSVVAITEQVTCKKGGLGTYYAEATIEVDAVWTDGDPAQVSVTGGTVWVAMTRLQKPRDVGIPAQWAAPEYQWTLQPTTYQLTAEKVWGKKVPPLLLTDGGTQYQLQAREADGSERKPPAK
jgi:hypothetical protein